MFPVCRGLSTDKREAVALLRACLCLVLGQLRPLRWCGHEAREEPEDGHFESRAPTGWYFEVRQVCFLAQQPSTDNGGAVALLRGRVCFVLGQVWLLRWCAHEAREETEEGHFESRPLTGWYLKVRQVCFLCARTKL